MAAGGAPGLPGKHEKGPGSMKASIFFKSPDHKQRFLTAMQHIGKVYDGKLDQEYGAALYILTADAGIWKSAQTYVERHAIDIEAMLAEIDLSHGYAVLVNLAGNLFNGEQHLEALELMRLDENNFSVALTAIRIRRAGLQVQDF
jgi:hypothetical protein